jgi:hypothetical protein
MGSSVRLATACAPSPPKPRNWAYKPAGQIPGAPRALDKAPIVTLCLQRKSNTLCEKICLSAVSAVVSSSQLLRAPPFQKGAFQNDICWFESSMPRQWAIPDSMSKPLGFANSGTAAGRTKP